MADRREVIASAFVSIAWRAVAVNPSDTPSRARASLKD